MTHKESVDFIISVVKEERGHISLIKPITYGGYELVVTDIFANGTLMYWYRYENNRGNTTLSGFSNDIIDDIVDCIKNNYYI